MTPIIVSWLPQDTVAEDADVADAMRYFQRRPPEDDRLSRIETTLETQERQIFGKE